MSNAIEIQVKTHYIEDQSKPEEGQYVYAYTIRIENQCPSNVQLLSRKWTITDAKDQIQEVEGIGVVGEQPVIAPGESYTYTSGAVIATASGTMSGSYSFKSDNGEQFEAPIPTFALVRPELLH
ncbi:Protein ApaG [Thalassocella blandensis]|nr:Protein ApaG [Thalassocella blandensis]